MMPHQLILAVFYLTLTLVFLPGALAFFESRIMPNSSRANHCGEHLTTETTCALPTSLGKRP
jgi:hypothetical protein